mmetsp:Transcript_41559/g.114461  ORF Transcript_41559/g.114461 Transcript_41559/m.114461 type:complete len:533 (-) Transcript_41559:70-1668(-)
MSHHPRANSARGRPRRGDASAIACRQLPKEVNHIYHEIEHIVLFAGHAWEQRSSATCPQLRDGFVSVKVGLTQFIMEGEEVRPLTGGSATPERSPSRQSVCAPLPAPYLRSATGFRWSGKERVGGLKSFTDQLREEFVLPDYVAMESPLLARKLAERQELKATLEPIQRPAVLFNAVIALMKLRWLLRLHVALVELGGARCSLEPIIHGMLVDMCGAHRHPHSPLQVFELMTWTFRARFQHKWPVFLGFVASHDLTPYMPCKSPLGRAAGDSADGSLAGSLLPRFRASTPSSWARRVSPTHRSPNVELWRLVDEVFIAWLVQQDPRQFPAAKALEEFDFYEMERPRLKTCVRGLAEWQNSALPKPLPSSESLAQQHAHRLASLLEVPGAMLTSHDTLDDIVSLAGAVLGHPKTFPEVLRARVLWNLEGAGVEVVTEMARADCDDKGIADSLSVTPSLFASTSSRGSPSVPPIFLEDVAARKCMSPSDALDHKQAESLILHNAYPRDCGRLPNAIVETLRDRRPPWLVGGKIL